MYPASLQGDARPQFVPQLADVRLSKNWTIAGDGLYYVDLHDTQRRLQRLDLKTGAMTFSPPTPVTYGIPPITLIATGGASGNPVTFSVLSGPGSVSGANGSMLTITGAGTIFVAANQAGNSSYQAATQVTASIVVNQAGVIVTLVPSRTSGNSSTTFTYTATVTSTTTGTITITATPTSGGPFTYGPLALSGGVASSGSRMTGAANGPVTVTASYNGDANFVANVGSTLVTLGTANYTLAASPSNLTVTRSTPASTTITMTPLNGYVGTATFSCGSLPAYATCTFTPSSITTTDGVTPQTSVMTIDTLAPSARPGISASMLWIPGAMFALLVFIGRKRMNKRMQSLLMLLLLATLALGASGCGSRASFATPTGADSITLNVTAVGSPGTGSSNLNQTLNLTVTIQ
jgi:hypothetical protein